MLPQGIAELLLLLYITWHMLGMPFVVLWFPPAGHDVTSCRYTGNGSKFCRLCGGRAKVQAACDANTDCVAFDMEGADCGYLKAAKGPLKTTAPGFTTYARV